MSWAIELASQTYDPERNRNDQATLLHLVKFLECHASSARSCIDGGDSEHKA
jgi:hypothetical protein